MVRAGIYARISSDREGDGLAIERQLEDCEALAARQGWTVVDQFVDQDFSAYSGKVRPEYRRMLAEVEAGELDEVVVYHLDRLHRQPKELEEFLEVCDRAGGVGLACATGTVDLATHDGQFTARILSAVAKKESDDKSRRIRRKHEEIALAGRVSGGGSRPFGWEPDRRTIRPEEAAVIRECVTWLLAGESIRSICTRLNARGTKTSTGKDWAPRTMSRMLASGRISGQRDHKRKIVATAVWEPVVSPAETERIRALLSDPSRRTNRTARKYLLARLLRCGHCGATLIARPRADHTRRYVCASGPGQAGCGKITVVADSLERFVAEAVLHRLDSPELAAALSGRQDEPAVEQWQREVERAQAQHDELALAYADQKIGLQEWLTARGPIEQRLQTARKRLAALNRTSAIAGHIGNATALREQWPTLPLSRQAAIVAAVLDHLTVNPGRQGLNRLDPERLVPVWRG